MEKTVKLTSAEKMKQRKKAVEEPHVKNWFSAEGLVCIGVLGAGFTLLGIKMGGINMVNTMIHTAYALLTDTVLLIMGIAVLVGGIAGILTEFGVVAIVNKLISPLMKPLYGLPGASIVGVITTFLSDNPAILTLANDNNFRRYFKKYQLPALTNIGTAFGMGLIIMTFMIGLSVKSSESYVMPAIVGVLGAVVGSIVSTRIMLLKTKKLYGMEISAETDGSGLRLSLNERTIREGNIGERAIAALLEGGKNGVNMGVAIVPGVLIICTLILILTNGPSEAGTYTGAAYEGVAFLPYLADKISFLINPLFGFTSPECVAVPITSLGAAGAAIGLVPGMVSEGLATGNDIAVFTAMCMCWSGYLSTHVAMMDGLNFRELTGHAILSHTIGGLCAGISAHWMFVGFSCIF